MYKLSCNQPFSVLTCHLISKFCCSLADKTLDLIKTNLSYTLSISSCTLKIHSLFNCNSYIKCETVVTTPDRQVAAALHTFR